MEAAELPAEQMYSLFPVGPPSCLPHALPSFRILLRRLSRVPPIFPPHAQIPSRALLHDVPYHRPCPSHETASALLVGQNELLFSQERECPSGAKPPVRRAVFSQLFAPFPSSNRGPDTTPDPRLIKLRFKISLSSIDPRPPFLERRRVGACNRLAAKKWSHFYISEPPPRAWSRMTGVENSLK